MNEMFPNIERHSIEEKYKNKIEINKDLTRQLVSFQANKSTKFYRWYKYKEAFSQQLVTYLLSRFSKKTGHLLDPFAGVGTALFAARSDGWKSIGIELLPVGIFNIKARLAAEKISPDKFRDAINKIKNKEWTKFINSPPSFKHVGITHGAYPDKTEKKLHAYLAYCSKKIFNGDLKTLFKFAAFSILEAISYTRKDGQYLRWTNSPSRPYASKKRINIKVYDFEVALNKQLEMMLEDLTVEQGKLFSQNNFGKQKHSNPDITLYEDSCLTRLRKLKSKQFNFIITSPPYCNRYDYTRTYALELVFLGADEERIRNLRQEMLSCTVENNEKVDELQSYYRKERALPLFEQAIKAFDEQSALQEILFILDTLRKQGKLNNLGIATMVRNYFLEMSLVVHECARLLKPDGYFIMVNDNVSYNGQNVPVDLILSEFAKSAGLDVEVIWKLSKGKGESSQQMGRYGRHEQRKCVYVWKRPKVI